MRYLLTLLTSNVVAVLASALAVGISLARAPIVGGGRFVYHGAVSCVAQAQANLAIAEAWAWSLRFGHEDADAARLATGRLGRAVRL